MGEEEKRISRMCSDFGGVDNLDSFCASPYESSEPEGFYHGEEPEEESSDWFIVTAQTNPDVIERFSRPEDSIEAHLGIDPELEALIPHEHEEVGSDLNHVERAICGINRGYNEELKILARLRASRRREEEEDQTDRFQLEDKDAIMAEREDGARADDYEPEFSIFHKQDGPDLPTPEALRYIHLDKARPLLRRKDMIRFAADVMSTYIMQEDETGSIDYGQVEQVHKYLTQSNLRSNARTGKDKLSDVLNYIVKQVPSWRSDQQIYKKRTVFKVVDLVMRQRWDLPRRLDVVAETFGPEIDREDTLRMVLTFLRMRTEPLDEKQHIYREMRKELWRAETAQGSGLYHRQEVLNILGEYFI